MTKTRPTDRQENNMDRFITIQHAVVNLPRDVESRYNTSIHDEFGICPMSTLRGEELTDAVRRGEVNLHWKREAKMRCKWLNKWWRRKTRQTYYRKGARNGN